MTPRWAARHTPTAGRHRPRRPANTGCTARPTPTPPAHYNPPKPRPGTPPHRPAAAAAATFIPYLAAVAMSAAIYQAAGVDAAIVTFMAVLLGGWAATWRHHHG